MGRQTFWIRFLVLAALFLLCPYSQAADKQFDYCNDLAKKVLDDHSILDPTPGIYTNSSVLNIINASECFIQANVSNNIAIESVTPARVSLFNAVQSFSGSQQQGSNLSSSGSTNVVTKPSGPTALIEEFGGANANTSTSSSTFQWSPGTMLTNLALTGVNYQCLTNDYPNHCISAGTLRNLTPLTLKITGNTTSGTPSMNGTATSSTSTAPAQQVTVNSKGTSGPSFTGLSVQYAILDPGAKSAVSSLASKSSKVNPNSSSTKKSTPSSGKSTPSSMTNTPQYYANELRTAWSAGNSLANCDAYVSWQKKAKDAIQPKLSNTGPPTDEEVKILQEEIQSQYGELLENMTDSPSCQPALNGLKGFYAGILEAETYEYFGATSTSSAQPVLALEYDLNTPQSKPSYSGFKVTGTWKFGKGTPTAPSLKTQIVPVPSSSGGSCPVGNLWFALTAVTAPGKSSVGNEKVIAAEVMSKVLARERAR